MQLLVRFEKLALLKFKRGFSNGNSWVALCSLKDAEGRGDREEALPSCNVSFRKGCNDKEKAILKQELYQRSEMLCLQLFNLHLMAAWCDLATAGAVH
eukprot:scaffold302205_cov19-Tisochrysis_lutea.AAC.1